MIYRAGVALLMLTGAAFAQAEPFEVKTENVELRDGLIRISFSARNLTPKPESVFVSCTVFAKGQARTTVTGLIKNVPPGEKGFEEAAARPQDGADAASCRFSSVSRVRF